MSLPNPVGLSIEITSRCNANCTMCPRTARADWGPGADMPTAQVLEVARQGIEAGVEIIHPHHFGEPTLHPDYPRILHDIRRMGGPQLTIKTFTNGSRLWVPEIRNAIRECATQVVVSVDGYTPKTMRQMRPGIEPSHVVGGVFLLARPGRNCAVWSQMVVVRGENDHEADGYRAFWVDVGVDEPLLWPDLRTAPVFAPNPCSRLWREMTVRVDGTVLPCCRDVDAEFPLGNAFEQQIGDIWRGIPAALFREAHRKGKIPMCRACTWQHTYKGEIDA
uniref:Putative radical SAM superfamily protein n=1 Tax=viral metagenome TaxID=1070528 RepID=A0A6M3INC0_9ZZZZ